MAKFYTNKYAGPCNCCGQNVPVGDGYGRYEGRGRNAFKVYHNSQHCLPADMQEEVRQSNRRVLTAEGQVFTPYEPNNLSLLRSFPGARWDRDNKCWTVSLKAQDRARVLEIADQLALDVAPELRVIERPAFVDAVLDRARKAGAYDFQVEGIEFLALSEGARLLADDQGTGKTIQTLMAIPDGSRVLAVVPAAVKGNWADECRSWRPDLTPVVLKGSKSFRWPEANEVIIINPESLPTWMSKAQKGQKYFRPDWDADQIEAAKGVLLVADEAHLYKNHKAARSKRMTALATYTDRAWALTGTPLLNRPFDLWGVLSSFGLQWDVFGGWQRFINLFGGWQDRFNAYHWSSEPSPEVAERLRRVMLRRTKAEVLPDLPAKTFQTLRVDIPASLKRALDKLWKDVAENTILARLRYDVHSHPETVEDWFEMLVMAKGHPIAEDYLKQHGCPFTYEEAHAQIEEAIREAIISKVSNRCLPPFEKMSEVRAKLAASRIKPLIEIVESYEDAGKPLVVFSAHRAPVDDLGTREGWETITGSTKPADRSDIVRRFQAGELKGIALTIAAGGVGLTLTKADTMVFVDLDWTPALNVQAEDRIHRIGQNAGNCHYIQMVSDHPLDRRIHELLNWKMGIIRAALDSRVEAEAPSAPKHTIREESREDFEARVEATRQAEAARQAAIARAEAEAEARAQEAYNNATRSRLEGWMARYSERNGRNIQTRISKRRAGQLREAFSYLLGSCDGALEKDGVGFNKPDASIAHRLHTLGLDETEVIRLLDVMLYKYHQTQLSGRFPGLY